MVTHTPTQCDTRLTVGVAPIHEAHCTSCSRYRTRPISRLRERTVTKPFTLAFARQSGPTVVHCLRIVSHELLSRRSDTQCQTSYPDPLVSPLPRRTICPDITVTRGTEFRTCSDRYRVRGTLTLARHHRDVRHPTSHGQTQHRWAQVQAPRTDRLRVDATPPEHTTERWPIRRQSVGR